MAWWIFQSLVTTAALAALVAVVCRFGKIGPVARHALWVLVLVKFVMPPLVVWPWAAPDPLGLAKVESTTAGVGVSGRSAVESSTGIGEAEGIDLSVQSESLAAQAPAPDPSSSASISPWTLFALVWISGTVCLTFIEIIRQIRLARRVRRAGAADPSIVSRVQELAADLGVPAIPVIAMPGSTSPAVWCLGRPRLLWPDGLRMDTQACIDGVIVHELAHIKRRDHVVGWIELVAGLMWWWNPLFWSVRRALREQAELACDAWVISALPNGRRAYAESLLALSSPGAPKTPPMAAVLGVRASSRRLLERRLVMIMNGRTSLRLPWAGFLTLALLAAATLPAWATGSDDDQQKIVEVKAAQAKPEPQVKKEVQVKPVPKIVHQQVEPKAVHTVTHEGQQRIVTVVPKQKTTPPVYTLSAKDGQKFTFFTNPTALTEEGQKLVSDLAADTDAIQKEADAKIAARREAAIKALEALQDQYTKAGKLDEAVAIRDYLRRGGPGNTFHWIKR
jgi:beta-lactamase regulating signal transducer with metallopeptidase domain